MLLRSSIFFLFLLSFGAAVEAKTTCLFRSTCELYNGSSLIFIGKPVFRDSEWKGTHRTDTTVFEVSEYLSGGQGPNVVVRSGELLYGSPKFGRAKNLLDNEPEYLVFASGNEHNGFYIDTCSHMSRADLSADQIKEIRKLAKKDKGTLYGRIMQETLSTDYRDRRKPLHGAKLLILDMNGSKTFSVKSDSQGKYKIDLPTGWYQITPQEKDLETPKRYSDTKIFLRAGGCQGNDVLYENRSRVAGRITDEAGTAVFDTRVELTPVGRGGDLMQESRTVNSARDGSFVFEALPIGKYVLAVNYLPYLLPRAPYRTIFYPANLSRSDAKLIEIGRGTSINEVELRLISK